MTRKVRLDGQPLYQSKVSNLSCPRNSLYSQGEVGRVAFWILPQRAIMWRG
jgi:hypothetical protein